MAYIRQTAAGRWRAEVERRGVREARNFATKKEAKLWAAQREGEILAGAGRGSGAVPRHTLREAVERYWREVSAARGSAREDRLRLSALLRDHGVLVDKALAEIRTADLAAWRDARLSRVAPATVQREINTLRPIWRLAQDEWGWLPQEMSSPWRGLRLPPKTHARTRRVSWREARAILRNVGFHRDIPPSRPMEQAIWAWVVALHTALRAGEIMKMARSNVDLKRRIFTIAQHKTQAHVGERRVPITPRAARILRVLEKAAEDAGRDNYFTVSETSRDTLFRKVVARLMIEDMHFHDSRAAALTWLAKRYDVMTLARISGHVDINMLYNTYYRETPEDVAARL